MRTRRIVIAAGALIALALTGCSSTSAESSPESSPAPAATSESTTSATTTSQWASAIAPLKSDFNDEDTTWENQGCSPQGADEMPLCNAELTNMGLTAKTASISIDSLTTVSATTYLGLPPDELSDLYDKTLNAARLASNLSEDISCPGDDCISTSFQFLQAWDALGDAYAAWEPYL